MAINPGDIVGGKYRIERELGGGTFAQVYLATHLNLNEPRALKILRRDGSGGGSSEIARYRDRFQLEAQIGAQLEHAGHAHIIRVYDFEQFDNLLVLVMEYAAGGSLAARIARARENDQPIPIDECVRIAIEIADGLAPIHAMDIVHRDLKPANILFDANGTTKVADLGLAQVETISLDRDVLGSSADWHPGTPPYMSPEQESTKAYLKPPSDIYALGLILFEMLTGRRYKNQRPGTRVRAMRPDVPEWLDDLLARLLAQDPHARIWDGTETAQALRETNAADARKIIEEQKRQAEEKAKRERAERAREEKARAKRAAEAKAKRAAEARAKRDAEEQAERERLAKAQHDAEAQAERERLAKAQREAEGQARREKEEREKRERLAKAQRDAEAQARREKEEREERERQEQIRREQELVLTLAPGVTLELMHVPAGEFLMGSNKQKDTLTHDDETPQHKVYLNEYWIGKHPVTVAQFSVFVRATYHQGWSGDLARKANHPATVLIGEDAKRFCQWVSGITKRAVRLPTEAEWEKAARGTDGRFYPWGDEKPDANRCNFNSNVDTTSVGKYSPLGDSPYGCTDMAGNVWEWCADWYDENYYRQSPAKNPAGPNKGSHRVLRGGSFKNDAANVRCACRSRGSSNYRNENLGFRICVLPSPSALKKS